MSPRIWTGRLGLSLRGDATAQMLACYLLSNRHVNMIGLCHLPMAYMEADTGAPRKALAQALRKLQGRGFVRVDEATETVWVVEYLRHEVDLVEGAGLKPGDKRVKKIRDLATEMRGSALFAAFCDRYADACHFRDLAPNPAPFQGASKGLRSQEQEQEQEQEPFAASGGEVQEAKVEPSDHQGFMRSIDELFQRSGLPLATTSFGAWARRLKKARELDAESGMRRLLRDLSTLASNGGLKSSSYALKVVDSRLEHGNLGDLKTARRAEGLSPANLGRFEQWDA
ncbi:MAG: hypothetical protein AAGN66_07045 [Acidobacteriota bacterium]